MTKSENDDGSNPYVRFQVIDVDISLWSMVGLLVKLALAAIPAMLIIAIPNRRSRRDSRLDRRIALGLMRLACRRSKMALPKNG